jgi:hypothetical protein
MKICAPFLAYPPSPEEIRQACAIAMLPVGVSVFALQTLDPTGRFSRNLVRKSALEGHRVITYIAYR